MKYRVEIMETRLEKNNEKRDIEIKPRWFIILGTTSTITPPICLHLCTTTTQLTYYQPGGNRCKNIFHSFKKGEFGFEDDCILDIDYDYYYLPQQDYEKSIDKIESKGKLDKDTIIDQSNII